jgi:hypothetical protein
MPRRKVVRKERGVFEKVPGSDIWWIRYYVDGHEHRERWAGKQTPPTSTGFGAPTSCEARRCLRT